MTQLNYSRYELDANLEDKRKSSILDIIILKKGKTKPSKLNSFRYKQPVELKSTGENKALRQQLRPDVLIVYHILHSDRIPNFLEKRSGILFNVLFAIKRYSKRIFETQNYYASKRQMLLTQ